MAEDSVFREVLLFFDKLGIYDVILPFLLVFAIFFAILERTKVLGTEKAEGSEEITTKKNLNAIVAFCTSFFFIASTKLVGILNEGLPMVALLLVVLISFILLIGVFHSEKDEVLLDGPWKTMMMVLMFIGIILIFAWSIKTDSGEPWLEYAYDYVVDNYDSTAVSALILAAVTIGVMVWLTRSEKPQKSKD